MPCGEVFVWMKRTGILKISRREYLILFLPPDRLLKVIPPCCFQTATGRTRISGDVPSGEPPKLEPAGELLSNFRFFFYGV